MPLARVDAAASRRVGARSRPGATFCRRAGRSLSRALVGAALKEGRRVSGTSRHLCCTCKRREGPAAVSVCPARWGLPRATAALSGRSRTGSAQAEETGQARREWRGRVGWDLSGIWGEMPSAEGRQICIPNGERCSSEGEEEALGSVFFGMFLLFYRCISIWLFCWSWSWTCSCRAINLLAARGQHQSTDESHAAAPHEENLEFS